MKIPNIPISYIYKRFNDNFGKKGAFRFAVILFIIIISLELTVFNFNSYLLMLGDYEETKLSLSEAKLNKLITDENGFLHNEEGGESTIEFSNVDIPIGTIYLDIEYSDDITQTTISIDIKDSTNNAQYRYGAANITIIKGYERSQTIPCQFSGEVSDMRLKLNLSKTQNITIKEITINKPISLHFSLTRVSFLFFIIIFAYLMIRSEAFNKSYEEKRLFGFRIIVFITIIFLVFSILVSAGYRSRGGGNVFEDFKLKEGSQITKELVDAFENGQVVLLEEPPEALKNLENPYDWSQRKKAGLSYQWDHCYYDGHYYSYYGIAPVIVLFLPYHLITGFYFHTTWAVLIFSMIGIIFLSKLYLAIIKKWFLKLQLKFVVMGLIFLQISSGIWFSISRAEMYEIAISSGFAFALMGSYFLITSNVVGDGKISKLRVALATTFLSIAVLCRPTLAVYCLAALAFLYFGLKKLKSSENNKNKKIIVKYLISSLLPFIIFGGIQMVYNWMRFDSPFDFGIQYSLTINDFTNSQFHIHFVLVCIFSFLFAAPYFQPQYPFVYSSFQLLNMNGFMYVDDKHVSGIAIGLFFRALPMFAYFLSRRAYRLIEKPNRKKALILIALPCLLAPFAILVSIWESGYAVRYNADFSWQMLIGALIILFAVIIHCKNEGVLKITATTLTVSLILCVMINFAQLYSFVISRYVSSDISAVLYSYERLIEFWR
ncbi:MAG: hypothetical protein A2Y15_08455 [Clostridiales bacterium GWF2_36_10]|nr:MAG: hypothetical protein A2Y15_08455 [Clostridiales bacterium GWF2_36_10]HAN21800.1 hypothetical protein [Clostridiales bacterium]